METTKTLKLRVKDKHAGMLRAMARDVNTVWNYCNETQYRSLKRYCHRPKLWLSSFDLINLTAGFVKCDGVIVGAKSVQEVCKVFATRLKQFRKAKLNWRVSDRKSAKYSLGWVPFTKQSIQYKNGQLWFNKTNIGLWDSYGLSKYELLAGSFNEDSRGRWYVNIAVKMQNAEKRIVKENNSIGIDLGLKTTATYSDGNKFDMPKWYRLSEEELSKAQRAKKKRQVKAIHTKIKNQRKDAIHKETTKLVKNYAVIFVGNVRSVALVKTKMAKSVLDAGWGMFKAQLKYKAIRHCAVFQEVNESFSTQTCSSCGSKDSTTRPRGIAGLGIREWTCCHCGTSHDRDVNAARNILRCGHASLVEGISCF